MFEKTVSHATREDPSRGAADILILLSSLRSLRSLGALVFLPVNTHTSTGSERGILAAMAVISVALSWILVHTLFTLHYASLYYSGTA
ncbi:MAG: DUF1345 domain-containing protein, partial [Cryobacterium sp.]|nr:DUF1345 domain-containing protein [Cryobacterium sp.]